MSQFSFERTSPHLVGISAQSIHSFLDELESKKIELHSFMLVRHGKVAAEGWWAPYAKDELHMLYSLSKSFTATAVGFAVQEDRLSVDDKLIDFFSELLSNSPCEHMRRMTIKNLLTMSTGHAQEPVLARNDESDWTQYFLHSYVELKPGSRFLYNTPATYMLSAVLHKITGENLVDYLKPRLFEPLGIQGVYWETNAQGIATGGFGLNVHTEDIARFGQFLLNKGAWQGVQLLCAQWVEEMTAKQVDNSHHGQGRPDWQSGYGYQIWRCAPQGVYRGDGAFGQFCIVMPEQDAVLAITSATDDMQGILTATWNHLLPEMKEGNAPDAAGEDELLEHLRSLSLCVPEGTDSSPIAAQVSGKTYVFGNTPIDLINVRFDFSSQESRIHYELADGTMDASIGYKEWKSSKIQLKKEQPQLLPYQNTALAGAWNGEDYALCSVYFNTPVHDDWRITFKGNSIVIDLERNVDFGPVKFRLVGVQQ